MVAIKDSIEIDLIVNFEKWDDQVAYDRLGLDQHYETIFDVKVPYLNIPIKPGRNLAILLETAAVDIRQKTMVTMLLLNSMKRQKPLQKDKSYKIILFLG